MKGHAHISPIYRHGLRPHDADPLAAYARVQNLRRKAWRDLGTIVVTPKELPEPLRAALVRWVENEYGAR